jgi:hypothetical protein
MDDKRLFPPYPRSQAPAWEIIEQNMEVELPAVRSRGELGTELIA